MPNYTFQKSDGSLLTKRLSFVDYDAIKAGTQQLVDDQGQTLALVFNPGEVGFVLKDGASGGWASKAMKENKYRAERGQVMARRERDHAPRTRLIPNYQGQEGHSWADVQDHVRTTDGVAAASTYNKLVAKESKGTTT